MLLIVPHWESIRMSCASCQSRFRKPPEYILIISFINFRRILLRIRFLLRDSCAVDRGNPSMNTLLRRRLLRRMKCLRFFLLNSKRCKGPSRLFEFRNVLRESQEIRRRQLLELKLRLDLRRNLLRLQRIRSNHMRPKFRKRQRLSLKFLRTRLRIEQHVRLRG